ncbi:MAG: glutamyl-tRNA reductase [Candidatus Delongbacteria bacterium]|nr:glutamyl-tRNA reductase [Candidatus Delongbacteria bacterium]MBN2834653.1 glutamyl-tRNA reductase [Candidatus Delongbacteria bacterium]
MHTILVGLNHKTACVETRELLYFSTEGIEKALLELVKKSNLEGAVIISTCNRVEIYSTSKDPDKGFEEIIDFISEFHRVDKSKFEDKLYMKRCEKAVDHLFKVVSSLDSMVLGETQIQGQVRDAYEIAMKAGTTNTLLNKLFQTSIQIGKKTRSSTNISDGKLSVATAGVELVNKIFPDNNSFSVLVIGAGEMAELTLVHLKENGNCKILISNRSLEKAQELADKFNGEVIPFESRYEIIPSCDIIIVSTGAQNYIIESKILKETSTEIDKLQFFIDLSVPRNIDPDIKDYENMILYSIDDLEGVVSDNIKKREEKISAVNTLINELASEYYDWYARQTIIPVMKGIKKRFEDMSENLISINSSKLQNFTSNQIDVLKYMMEVYSDRIIKIMMQNLKNVTNSNELGRIAESLQKSLIMDIDHTREDR